MGMGEGAESGVSAHTEDKLVLKLGAVEIVQLHNSGLQKLSVSTPNRLGPPYMGGISQSELRKSRLIQCNLA